MDYTSWPEMQQPHYETAPIPQIHSNPNYAASPNPQNYQMPQNPSYPTPPNPQDYQIQQNPVYAPDPNAQNPYPFQNYYYPQSVNPNPSVDHHQYYQQPQQVAQYTVSHEYSYQQTVGGYQNPVGCMTNEHVAVDQYAFSANNTMGLNMGTYRTNHLQNRVKWKKAPKKTMVVQSAWCDICHIKCDTNDVLVLHKQGKKHKKNLEKLIKAAAPSTSFAPAPVTIGTQTSGAAPIPTSASGLLVAYSASVVPTIGPQENPNASKDGKKNKRPKSDPLENLETKKKKVLEGGASAEAVRTCSVCNVVCNSDTVYSYHIAGQKHATMMKKHALLTTVATAL